MTVDSEISLKNMPEIPKADGYLYIEYLLDFN